MKAVEKSANSTFCYNHISRWIGLRLDFICGGFAIVTAALCIFLRNSVETRLLTFSLQIVTDVITLFSLSVRMFSEIQNMMTSSQRLYQYTQLESEDALEKESDKKLEAWPNQGAIEFEGVSMKYRETMEPSLIDLSCKV